MNGEGMWGKGVIVMPLPNPGLPSEHKKWTLLLSSLLRWRDRGTGSQTACPRYDTKGQNWEESRLVLE